MNSVSINIRQLRKRDNLSQEILAEKLSVTRQAISDWETGKTQPDIDTLVSIAAAFNVDVTEVIYGETQNEEAYLSERKKRKALIYLFGSITALFVLLEIFLMPYFEKLFYSDFRPWPLWIYASFFRQILYLAIPLLFFNCLSLRFDIIIKNTKIRKTALIIGLFLIFIYYLIALNCFVSILPSSFLTFSIFYPVLENPSLFLIPGTMLFFGFNK